MGEGCLAVGGQTICTMDVDVSKVRVGDATGDELAMAA